MEEAEQEHTPVRRHRWGPSKTLAPQPPHSPVGAQGDQSQQHDTQVKILAAMRGQSEWLVTVEAQWPATATAELYGIQVTILPGGEY